MENKTKVFVSKTNIKGPKIDKNGKNYWTVGIQTRENGEKWFNCSYFPFNPDRWEGSEQEVILYDEEYQGKMYSKFKLPMRERGGSGGLSDDDRAMIKKASEYAYAANTNIVLLTNALKAAGMLKSNDSYPESNGPTAFDEPTPLDSDIDPRDIVQ